MLCTTCVLIQSNYDSVKITRALSSLPRVLDSTFYQSSLRLYPRVLLLYISQELTLSGSPSFFSLLVCEQLPLALVAFSARL